MISKLNRTVYTNGKSILSLSQMIGGNRKYIDPLMNNFYIHQHLDHDHESEAISQNEEKLLKRVIEQQKIVRCLISPKIFDKEMNLKINKLKRNPLLNHLIKLHENQKYKLKIPQIIIDSELSQLTANGQSVEILESVPEKDLPIHRAKHGFDTSKEEIVMKKEIFDQIEVHLQKNILELEKLLIDGLSLDISYMISKRNFFQSQNKEDKDKKNIWVECLSKKSKSIHSNIIENGFNFEETIYDEGYRLHHVFLSSYLKSKEKLALLEQNEAYRLEEVINILKMIDFNGKVILDCQKDNLGTEAEFVQNLEVLDKALKKGGYKRKQFDSLGGSDTSYISAL